MRTFALLGVLGLGIYLTSCSAGSDPVAPAPPTTSMIQALHRTVDGASLLAGFRIDLDPASLEAAVTPHRSASAQPPQGQRYDLDIANFQNADSLRITGVQVLGSGNFRLTFSHAHPFPAPDIANPISGTNRADLGYTGRLLVLTEYNPQAYFSGAVRLSAGAVVNPDGYVEPLNLLANRGLSLVTAYPYILLADEAEDNRVDVSNDDDPEGNYSPAAGGWQRVNLGADGDGWTGYDYVHGGQTITNQLTLSKAALSASNFALDVALLIQYTDPRGAGGATHRLPPAVINITDFAYRLPYAALDCSKISFTQNLMLDSAESDSATLEVRVRDWDAGADEAGDATVGDETDVSLVQMGASGAPAVVLDAPGILSGLRNMGTPTGTGLSDDPLLYSNVVVNQEAAPAGEYFACLRVVDPEDADTERNTYHFGVDPNTLAPSASRAIPARTWQVVPITITEALARPVVTSVNPTGIVGALDEFVTFTATATGEVEDFTWEFSPEGARSVDADGATAVVQLPGTPGTYTAQVTASNAAGMSAPFEFSYRVLLPQPPSFAFHELQPSSSTFTVSEGQRLFVINDRPILLYGDFNGGGNTSCAVARVPDPQQVSDWDIHVVIAGDYSVIAGAIINGRLAFATAAAGADIAPVYVRATVAVPSQTSDWVTVPVQNPEVGLNYGFPNELVALNNRPFIVASRQDNDNLYAYTTDTATPAGVGDFDRHLIVADVDALDLAVQTFPEGPRPVLIVSERALDRARLLVATVPLPASSIDWTAFQVDSEDVISVGVVAGRSAADRCEIFTVADPNVGRLPVVTQWEATSAFVLEQLWFSVLPTQSSGFANYQVSIGMHNDRPVVVYPTGLGTNIIYRALRPDPTLTDWVPVVPWGLLDMNRLSIASVDQRIAITGDSGNSLVYGIADGSW